MPDIDLTEEDKLFPVKYSRRPFILFCIASSSTLTTLMVSLSVLNLSTKTHSHEDSLGVSEGTNYYFGLILAALFGLFLGWKL